MADKQAPHERERLDSANLRLELHALTEKLNDTSLPEALKSLRRTIVVAATVIAATLLVTGVLHVWASNKVERLEKRVEQLELQGHRP